MVSQPTPPTATEWIPAIEDMDEPARRETVALDPHEDPSKEADRHLDVEVVEIEDVEEPVHERRVSCDTCGWIRTEPVTTDEVAAHLRTHYRPSGARAEVSQADPISGAVWDLIGAAVLIQAVEKAIELFNEVLFE